MNKQFLSKTLSIVLAISFGLSGSGILKLQTIEAGGKGSPTYNISIETINGYAILSLPLTLNNPISLFGNASSSKFAGDDFSAYQVQVDWGDGTIDPDSNVSFTGSGGEKCDPPKGDKCSDFSGTWSSNPDHSYLSGGIYTITVLLHHSKPAGGESSDAIATVNINVVIHYACVDYTCVEDTQGTYTTSDCNSECGTAPTHYACVDYTCVEDTQGTYTTANCDGACVAPVTTTTVPPGPTGAPIGGQYIVPTGVVAGAATEQGHVAGASTGCNPYLLKYIKLGADNDPEEVKKLESFLNEYLGVNLPINGIYEEADYNAVKQFQLLLKDDVLAPWVAVGCLPTIDTPTGYVYRTTKWTINNFFCPEPRPDVSDETCTGGIIIGLGEEEGTVLGEATTTPTTTTETTPPEETGTTAAPENGAKPSQNWLWYLIGIIVIGGVVYLAYSRRKK